jgi:hypothetical protein
VTTTFIQLSLFPMDHGPLMDFCSLDVIREYPLGVTMTIHRPSLAFNSMAPAYRDVAKAFKQVLDQRNAEKKYIVNTN